MKSFTPRAQRLVVALAQDEGRKSCSNQLLPEHVLLALLKSADGVGYITLKVLHINVLTYQLALEQSISIGNPERREDFTELPPSSRLMSLFESAEFEARSMRSNCIGTEHLVLAAIREQGSITYRYFEKAGIDFQQARDAVTEARRRISSSSENPQQKAGDSDFKNLFASDPLSQNTISQSSLTQNSLQGNQFASSNAGPVRESRDPSRGGNKDSFLAEYSRDLTENAVKGLSDPVVGRDKEIQRVIQILSRRTKNNPLLLGEPGVGKTAIIEGLAQRISQGEVPFNLLKKRVLSLDLTALIAGTKYRGEFEDRMKRLMKEVLENKNIILFIDEIHTIIGAGGPEGSLDASNILKPALSRGEIQIIGATTIKEYRKYMEKDSALERRFQTVNVEEPSDEETAEILEGIKKKYEEFHNVTYAEDVIPAIIKFSHRYLPERCLPDKAIDIMDEAGAQKKIQEEQRPGELVEIEKNIEELAEEKKLLVQNQDYEKAAEIRDKVTNLRKKLEAFSIYWKKHLEQYRKCVELSDICSIISQMTGVPVEQLSSNETQRLVHMEEELHRTVIGQKEAIRMISSAVRRSRAGISSSKRPLGSFIFLGPTGVGKTQLAKSLAKFLFGSEDSVLRIDMSDYMEKFNASRLVGAPPGYVGYENGGVLTEQVRRKPYSVILFDEIEKAHPDVFNLMLQILEEGELTDSLGHTVNFRNTIVIMTSNAGAREITMEGRVGFSTITEKVLPYDEIKSNAMQALKEFLRPELINRIDDIIVFDALNREQVSAILDLQIEELNARLLDQEILLSITSKARNYLIENGYDPSMGARPMRRLIQKEIEDPLSLLILEGKATHYAEASSDGESISIKFRKSMREAVSKKADEESLLEPKKPRRTRKTPVLTDK